MQRPLDPDILCALVREGGYKAGDSSWIASTKARFAEQNMSQAVLNLIMSFGMFRPYPHIHCWEWKDYGPHDWSIDFGVRVSYRVCRLHKLSDSAESSLHTSNYQA